jgi:hypothetical protein
MKLIISVIHSGERVSIISPAVPNIMIMYFTVVLPSSVVVRTPVGRSGAAPLDREREVAF